MMGYIPHQLAHAYFRNNGTLATNPYLEGTVEWQEFDSVLKTEIRLAQRREAAAKRASSKAKKAKKPKKGVKRARPKP